MIVKRTLEVPLPERLELSGDDYEEATGTTLDEALAGVAQLVRFDMAGRAP